VISTLPGSFLLVLVSVLSLRQLFTELRFGVESLCEKPQCPQIVRNLCQKAIGLIGRLAPQVWTTLWWAVCVLLSNLLLYIAAWSSYTQYTAALLLQRCHVTLAHLSITRRHAGVVVEAVMLHDTVNILTLSTPFVEVIFVSYHLLYIYIFDYSSDIYVREIPKCRTDDQPCCGTIIKYIISVRAARVIWLLLCPNSNNTLALTESL